MGKQRRGRGPKKTTPQGQIGERGVSIVRKTVTDMGFFWHDRRIDFGVDGVIELIEPESLVATGMTIDVQIKTTRERLPSESDDTFAITCDERDLKYWLKSGQPVILVFVQLATERAWFKDLNGWFSDQARRRERRVVFHKKRDRFVPAAKGHLVEIGTPEGYVAPRVARPERLISNLLPVERFAPEIFSAKTECRERGDAWTVMRGRDSYESGFHLAKGRIYSFQRLDEGPLAPLVKGRISSVATEEWASSDDSDVLRRFVALLNFTLRAMHHPDIAWHSEKKYTYFTAPRDRRDRRIKHTPRGKGRTVFSTYTTADGERVKYCRHLAADLRFRRYGGQWFLEIDPTYHYTRDGTMDSRFSSDLVKGMKQRERNPAVRDLVRTWAAFLRGEDTLLESSDPRIIFGRLEELLVDVGIDERAWKETVYLPESSPESDTGLQLEFR